MDITIVTSDPNDIDVEKIRTAIEGLNYFVNGITVIDRGL